MKTNILKRLTALAAGLCVLTLAAPSLHADEAEGGKKSPMISGKATYDEAANTLTVESKKDGTKTFTITDSTEFSKSDKSEATAADLADAKMVRVAAGDDDVATKVIINVPKPKASE